MLEVEELRLTLTLMVTRIYLLPLSLSFEGVVALDIISILVLPLDSIAPLVLLSVLADAL